MRKNKFGELLGKYLDFYNISINEFAERVDSTPKNIIDIIDGRISLSQNMIYNISFVTDISVSYIENVEGSFEMDNKIDDFIKKNNMTLKQFVNMFHYNELSLKYGVKYQNEKNEYSILEDIFKYLRINDPNTLFKVDNKIFYKSKNDKPELLALWLERCYRVIREQEIEEYNKSNINNLVKYIRESAKKNIFNKEELIKIFNKNGLFLAIEDDLTGSKIRGAFRVHVNKPAIYITMKHRRIADIYFALLHELAHCKTDFNRAKSGSIVSLLNKKSEDEIEIKADKQALSWMIPDEEYKEIIKSKNYKYPIMSFLVYRLALDKKITYSSSLYQENNTILYE